MKKKDLMFLITGIIAFIIGTGLFMYTLLKPAEEVEELSFPTIPSYTDKTTEKVYSDLTGEELADASLKTSPTYCIQTPNGTDGGRPQSGLNEAGVIFEAIAEAGITRFAAIYQNPTSTVIGPVRSLRLYYLDWDIPFDCTIVHAGGAPSALREVVKYRHQSESYSYMYRGTIKARRWNNLFTTAADLAKISSDKKVSTSNIKGFTRLTPEVANQNLVDTLANNKLEITTASGKSTSELTPEASTIAIRYGNYSSFNPVYTYNVNTNSYDRSYTSGAKHEIYACPSEQMSKKNPEDVCTLTQISPKVVIAMMVKETKEADNYHEAITTTGSGTVYIFQNGTATKGTWSKASREEQIKFKDEAGNDIALIPGQTFISAVPNYGSVNYE